MVPTTRTRNRSFASALPTSATLPTLLLFLTLLTALAGGRTFAQATAAALNDPPDVKTKDATRPAPIIDSIIVVGNKTLAKPFILIASGHKAGDACTPETLADMHMRLFETGYFEGHSVRQEDSVHVTALEQAEGKSLVTIEVDENPTISGIQLTGSGPISPADVLPLLHLTPGSVFNPRQFLMDALAIQKLYSSKGYIVSLEDLYPGKDNVLKVALIVTRIAEIKVNGNHQNANKAILTALKSKVGEYLNTNLLEADQKRLLGNSALHLKSAKISPRAIGTRRVGLTIDVVEAVKPMN